MPTRCVGRIRRPGKPTGCPDTVRPGPPDAGQQQPGQLHPTVAQFRRSLADINHILSSSGQFRQKLDESWPLLVSFGQHWWSQGDAPPGHLRTPQNSVRPVFKNLVRLCDRSVAECWICNGTHLLSPNLYGSRTPATQNSSAHQIVAAMLVGGARSFAHLACVV